MEENELKDLKIIYMDESGDDGFPKFSSDFFLLTSLYFSQNSWKSNFDIIYNEKKRLKVEYNFPVKTEFHCKEFITDKDPYHGKFSNTVRNTILFDIARIVSQLDCRIIIVFIDKKNISANEYNILENALNYNISRVDKDLETKKSNFLLISDEGRVDKMKKITRKIQKINFIPRTNINMIIKNMIEDPLPKSSNDSFFIQLADFCSYISYLYIQRYNRKLPIPKRVSNVINDIELKALMDIIKPKMNLNASRNHEYGIYIHPKKIG